MAQFCQGQAAEAQAALKRTTDAIDQKLPKIGRDKIEQQLGELLVCQTLRREAEAMLSAPAAVATARPGEPKASGITPRPDGTFRLEAGAARLVGHTFRLLSDQIVSWNNVRDYVEWKVQVENPAVFAVYLDYSCPPASAGSTYEFVMGNTRFSRSVTPTWNWVQFRAARLGVVRIDSPGMYTVQVRPQTKHGEAVMNLRSVILRPQSPEGVMQDDDGSFHLAAADARIVGHTAQLEDENIGYWNNPNDYVEWKLKVRTPGTFKVAIDYACPPPNAGTEYQVILGNQKLAAKVGATRGWRDFQTAQLGTLSIPAPGILTLQVKPIPKTMSPVMNLRTLILQPQ
jgi:hypothetical protein